MPRIRQKADEYATKDFVAEIKAQCARYGYRTQGEQAVIFGVSQGTVSSYLRDPDKIRLGSLRNVVQKLHLNPVIVLKALGYTSADIRKIKEE